MGQPLNPTCRPGHLGSRRLRTIPFCLLATHLRQGRDGLKAHTFLSTGWRPATGSPAALRIFRLPAPLSLQQAEDSQLLGQWGAGPSCIPTRAAPPEPSGGWALLRASLGSEPFQSQPELPGLGTQKSLPGMWPQKGPTPLTLPALPCAGFSPSPMHPPH